MTPIEETIARLLHGDEDTPGIRPSVIFADHSYPAYSANQMASFAALVCEASMKREAALVEGLAALERRATDLYRGIAPGGNYGTDHGGIARQENTFADNDEVIEAARALLTPSEESPS